MSSVGGVGDVLAWVVCLRGQRASVGGVLKWVTLLAWVTCLVYQRG